MKYDLSVIFPVYNEEKRLKNSLKKIYNFHKKNIYSDIEYLFIDDGSTDKTQNLIKKFLKKIKKKNFKYFKIKSNKGKGFALKTGVDKAKKKWIITADIDLSVPLLQINDWFKNKVKESDKIYFYFGNRNDNRSKVKKKLYRFLLGSLFNLLIRHLFKIRLNDTQCGFKLYKSLVAKKIFKNLSIYGFAHDIELVSFILKKKMIIKELPVTWTHVPNSKLNILIDPIKMFIDLLIIFIKINKNE